MFIKNSLENYDDTKAKKGKGRPRTRWPEFFKSIAKGECPECKAEFRIYKASRLSKGIGLKLIRYVCKNGHHFSERNQGCSEPVGLPIEAVVVGCVPLNAVYENGGLVRRPYKRGEYSLNKWCNEDSPDYQESRISLIEPEPEVEKVVIVKKVRIKS